MKTIKEIWNEEAMSVLRKDWAKLTVAGRLTIFPMTVVVVLLIAAICIAYRLFVRVFYK